MTHKVNLEQVNVGVSKHDNEKNYWLNKLSDVIAGQCFPYDYPDNIAKRFMKALQFEIPVKLSNRLIEIAGGSDIRLHMILSAGIIILLNKYTDDKDILVGIPIYKQKVEGEFTNTVVAVRNLLEEDQTFKQLIIQVKQSITEGMENANYPIETLLYHLNMSFSQGSIPLFDVAILLENIHDKKYLRHIRNNMTFSFRRSGEHLEGTLEYNAAVFEETTVQRIINHFLEMLLNAAFNVDLPIRSINVLPQEEKKILYGFNNNKVEIARDKTIHLLFERHAAISPNRTAVIFEGKESTYGELNENANRLARVLRNSGVFEDQMVGILSDRSPLTLEGILAVWKAGGAYIPIDPQYPAQRILGILADSAAGILLTREEFVNHEIEKGFKGKILKLDTLMDTIADENPANLDLEINMNSLAYVIYTSGSTGRPKGVMVEHIGMVNHIEAKIADLQMTEASVVAQNAAHTFDISVWQFFAALAVGGKTAIYSNHLVLDPEAFTTRILEDRVTILEVVPSYLSLLLDTLNQSNKELKSLNYLIVTGETLNPSLVKRWFSKYPAIKMVNAYGPTEASDDITHYLIDKPLEMERIPIGRSLRNLNLYIVDQHMNLSPIGVKGEICVAGIGVGRGYLNNEKTAAVFMKDPFIQKKRVRLYKTGDIGRWLPDGTIEFFGRKDFQVKISGNRIELGEIESKLMNYPDVLESVVIDREDTPGQKYLCAYIVPRKRMDAAAIKKYLEEHLPHYMIPSFFIELNKIPLTSNGKINRKELPEPEKSQENSIVYISAKKLEELKYEKNKTNNELAEEQVEKFFNHITEQSRIENELLTKFSLKTGRNYYPLTNSQKMIYYSEKRYSGTSCENLIYFVKYSKILDKELLNKATNQLLMQNDAFRLRMLELENDSDIFTTQYIADYEEKKWDYFDFSHEDGNKTLEKWIEENNKTPFIFNDTDLFYFAYIKLNESESGYYMKFNHIIDDGWTVFLKASAIDKIYHTLEAGKCIENTPNLSFFSYIGEERKYLISPQAIKDMKFWHRYLYPLPEPVTLSSKISDFSNIEAGELTFQFPAILRAKMHEYCKSNKTSLFKLILSALSIYITRITGSHDFIIGTLNHGRSSENYRKTPGIFIRFIPIRIRINENQEFCNLVKEIEENVNHILRNHQKYPFDFLIRELRERAGVDPTYFYNINLIGHPDVKSENYKIEHYPPPYETTPISIHINFCNRDVDGILELEWDYQKELFSSSDIHRIQKGLVNILSEGLANPGKRISEIEFLSEEEKEKVIYGISEREIEKKLSVYDGIEEAFVVTRNAAGGFKGSRNENIYYAYCVADKILSEVELRNYLSKELSSNEIPFYFVQLEKMPLAPSGEIDRDLLDSIDGKEGNHARYKAPGNPLEGKLVEIWGDVLGRKNIGIDENFFMIGGDSIKTIQIASRMKKAGYKIEMKDIFANPTIAQLAPQLKKLERFADQSTVTGLVPLTPIQKAFFSSSPTAPHHFNMSVLLFSEERLEEIEVRLVFTRVQEHHDALRMTFKTLNGEIIQTNHGLDYPLALEVFDFMDMKYQDAAAAMEQKNNEIQHSLCLEEGPLMKLGLFHLNDGDNLLIVIHHLVMDAISWRILLEDIGALFHQYKNNQPLMLPMKTDPVKTWAERLSQYANSESFLKEKSYWEKLESAIVPAIEKDFQEEINYTRDNETLMFLLTREDTELLLTKVNDAFGTEINDILLTALGLAVKNNFGISGVLIDLEGHGREEIMDDIDTKRTIGWFTSAYPIMLDILYDHDLARQIKEVKENLHRVPNKGIGYGILKYLTAEIHKKDIKFRLNPQISFNYLGQFDEDINQTDFRLAKEKTGDNQSPANIRKNELNVLGIVMNKRLEMSVSYNKKQYKKETAETFLNQLESNLIRIIAFCSQKKDKELTPSDFGYKEISLEQLDSIFQ